MRKLWTTSIFCVGYRIMQKDLEGTLDADKLKAVGVPFGPLFGQVKNGQDVTLEDGTKIIAADYISAPRPGKIITILGDTRKTDASVRLGVNADVLVHESTYGKGDEKIAKKHGHSTNMQAAEVARECWSETPSFEPHQCSLLIKRHQPIAQGCVQHF